MKFRIIHPRMKITVLVICLTMSCTEKKQGFHLSGFQDPPESAQIYTWWHWMDKAISREGITRDLESMKEQGVVGATILNIGLFEGRDFDVPQVPFNSPEWYDMFHFALEEADRLGIEIGIHNCDGWSTSGGPWITPEHSMKQFIWSTKVVEGGKQVSIELPQPVARMDFYRDVAVFAYPSTLNLRADDHMPGIMINDTLDGSLLFDGEPMSKITLSQGDRIVFAFSKPVQVDKIAIHPHLIFQWGPYNLNSVFDLEVSEDGQTFRKHADFAISTLNKTTIHSFPEVTAQYFRIIPRQILGLGDRGMVDVSEMELLGREESPRYSAGIACHLAKTVAVRPLSMEQMVRVDPEQMNAIPVSNGEVVDLTAKMTAEGLLEWEVPEGNWTVIRFGYTTTGAVNAPATDEGRGLECDKMDTTALNLHFASFPAKLIEAAGDMTGNSFKYLFIDSWECKYQNWAENFMQEFQQRRGYDMLPWMPALCGVVVESSDKTEAFLNDYRRTIADMIEEYYYRHYSNLCKAQHMELHAEVIYGGTNYPPLDVLRTNQYADLPMTEFWAVTRDGGTLDRSVVRYASTADLSATNPTHACAVYDLPVLASEAYTGFAHYSETPWVLKPFGDMAFCEGVNRMVLHSYVHQPFEKKPGFTLGQWGSHFNRHNPWWQHFSRFSTYLARQQYILQQGRAHADICYFIGDRMPDFQGIHPLYSLPYGYRADHINPDLLGQPAYRLLLLPDDPVMSLKSLQKLEKLVASGALVSGPKPQTIISLADYESESGAMTELAGKLWGNADGKTVFENPYGKGKVIWGKPIQDILEGEGILPDVENNDPRPENFRYIHKRLGSQDIYYLFNQSQEEKQVEFLFNVMDKTPSVYDPVNGNAQPCMSFKKEGSRTRVPLHFRPRQAFFLVFNEGVSGEHFVEILQDGKIIFPAAASGDGQAMPVLNLKETGEIELLSLTGGDFTLISNKGNTRQVKVPEAEILDIKEFKGQIMFHDGDAGKMDKTRSVEISELTSYTDYEDPVIKYFSGTASYTIQFELPGDWVEPGHVYFLRAGETGASAEIRLNGELLDVVWEPDYPIRLESLPQAGTNLLEVKTTNIWRNRIIGDLQGMFPEGKVWTTSPIDSYLNKNSELFPAGLRGPLRMLKYSTQPADLQSEQ